MKRVDIGNLQKKMILARPVVSERGQILLYEGAELSDDHIVKLLANSIEYVFINDTWEKITDCYSVESIENDSIDMIKNIVEKRIREDDESELYRLVETASKIIDDIVTKPEITACMINIKRKSSDIYSHMLNVASLSTIMAIKIGFDEKQLNDVAIGAMLHDIGLCNVDVKYEDVEMDTMPAADKLTYRKHVIQGYEMLQNYEWMTEMAKSIVLSHHERIDGSGYPFHKIGERIPTEVKLVAICDHFDELANGIGYKHRKVHEVVEFFRTNGAYLFDYDILNKVISNIAWFPTGSRVITNENEVAMVVKQNKELPDRPIIRILQTADGQECTEEVIKDLTDCLTVFISATLDE